MKLDLVWEEIQKLTAATVGAAASTTIGATIAWFFTPVGGIGIAICPIAITASAIRNSICSLILALLLVLGKGALKANKYRN